MKKVAFLFILLVPILVKASFTYTSIISGGNWETNATWVSVPAGGTYPQKGDNVIINTNVTATAYVQVLNLTINIGKTLTISGSKLIDIDGKLTNNGVLNTTGGGTI